MECHKCGGTSLELLRYQRGQRRVTLRCKRCGKESQRDAAEIGRAMTRLSQEYYEKSRSAQVRTRRKGCRGCGR